MTKEKLVSLKHYLDDLTNRLYSSIPTKHKEHPETYKQFLIRELQITKKKIDNAALEGVK